MIFPEIVPMSLPAIINRIRRRYPVTGRFYWEVEDELVKQARIVVLDIHWYTMLESGIALSHTLKAINPHVVLIAGGLSASMFYKQLLRDSALDYIIRGDGDRPLLDLITALMEDTDPTMVPNVVGREFVSNQWYALTQADLDDGDYRDISWFPTLQRNIYSYHRASRKRPIPVHPILVTLRGCPMPCDDCLGGTSHQRHVFKRGYLLRDADRVQDDLEAYSADPNIAFLYLFHDFITLAGREYVERCLQGTYNLHVFYEFFEPPEEQDVARLLAAFSGGMVFIPLDIQHSTSTEPGDVEKLIAAIRHTQAHPEYDVRLSYIKWGLARDARYAAAFKRVVKETGCRVYQSDWWWEKINPLPGPAGTGDESLYSTCLANTRRFRLFNNLFYLSVQAYGRSPTVYRACTAVYEGLKYYFPLRKL